MKFKNILLSLTSIAGVCSYAPELVGGPKYAVLDDSGNSHPSPVCLNSNLVHPKPAILEDFDYLRKQRAAAHAPAGSPAAASVAAPVVTVSRFVNISPLTEQEQLELDQKPFYAYPSEREQLARVYSKYQKVLNFEETLSPDDLQAISYKQINEKNPDVKDFEESLRINKANDLVKTLKKRQSECVSGKIKIDPTEYIDRFNELVRLFFIADKKMDDPFLKNDLRKAILTVATHMIAFINQTEKFGNYLKSGGMRAAVEDALNGLLNIYSRKLSDHLQNEAEKLEPLKIK